MIEKLISRTFMVVFIFPMILIFFLIGIIFITLDPEREWLRV